MANAEQTAYKDKLKQFGQQVLAQRVAAARRLMDTAQESANNEDKSSAGDKYETGRAMGHLEKDMHARQLAEHVKELSALLAVDTHAKCMAVTTGALVRCTDMVLFLSIGLGKQVVDGQVIVFLSPLAPLAKQLWNKKAGDEFLFNNKTSIIMEVY